MPQANYKTLIVVFILFFTLLGNTVGFASYSDLDDNWAKEQILSLEAKGLFADLEGEEFKPHDPLSHETSLGLIARAFKLEPEQTEQLNNWLKDNFARDPEGITRGEFISLLTNVLGIGEQQQAPSTWYPSFADVSRDYPGFLGVETGQKLGLLPGHMLIRFEPYRLITRGEVAYLIHAGLELEQVQGSFIAQGEQDELIIQTVEDTELKLRLLPETLCVSQLGVVKNQELKLEAKQEIGALVRNGKVLLLQLDQEEQSTTQALLQGINNVTKVLADVLTPEQVSAIIAGDWDQLGEEVRYEVYEELVKRGVAPWEADAFIKQDWPNLQTMIQERLTQEAADYLQVTPELVHSAITQDWAKVLEYAQVELAQRLLTSDWLKGLGQN